MKPVLETHNVSKSFAGVQALSQVNLRVDGGNIHALLGHNGAGKSTLIKVLTGIYPSGDFDGEIVLQGRPVAFRSPADARAKGIAYVPQEISVLEHLSVAENVFVGRTGVNGSALVSFRDLYRRTRALLAQLDIELDPRLPASSLTATERQLLMVARALSTEPAVLMLDEPTTSLARTEVDHLFRVLNRLRENGVTMIFITHRIPEVGAICDRATVLRDGQVVAEIARDEFQEDDIVAAMVGRRVERLYPSRAAAAAGDAILEVEELRVARPGTDLDLVHGVGFTVRRGEIVGLAGLVGSGRTEILSAIYGRVQHEGRIVVDGKTIKLRRPSDARRAGIAMLTEDRKREGLLFNMNLRENVTIGNLALVSHGVLVDRRAEAARAQDFMEALSVRARSATADVAHLSGGNQQKVLLARVLMNAPKVLLLDEPTKGVDVGTKQEIYRLIVQLADEGMAIVMVSSEIPELLGLCDRCLVLAGGTIVDEFARGEGSEERVIEATTLTEAA
ncbi:MAG: transporter related protein [Actinomycetia bacterium]|jgi:ABC-type sugar transport system ATPase subunit|nr:transporter related protein [Actinomycetes bacterium]